MRIRLWTALMLATAIDRAWAQPDTTPPGTVHDLRLVRVMPSSILVKWTATGDDGNSGRATSYDLRYSTAGEIDVMSFQYATPVIGEPIPGFPGAQESFSFNDGTPGVPYWFAIEVIDEAGNNSWVSNSPMTFVPTGDWTPPAAVTTLTTISDTAHAGRLIWLAPGDDGMNGTAAMYDIRVSTSGPILNEDWFQWASPLPGEPAPRPAHHVQQMSLSNLVPGIPYWFAMKTVDDSGNWSDLSNSPMLILDAVAPARISDLAVAGVDATAVKLEWTAPGEDGDQGTASIYDLRYSTTGPITTEEAFLAAAAAPAPVPQPAGGRERVIVNGLRPGTAYWFAVVTVDAHANRSPISNGVSARTRRLVTAAVADPEP